LINATWLSSAWSKRTLRATRTAGAAALVLAAASCGSIPKTHYYTLEIPPPPSGANLRPRSDRVLGIERFRAPEVLRDDRILYYESPTQLNFYEYHRWAAEPADLFAEAIARRLRREQLFAEVRKLPARSSVDYILRGHVLNFEEVDEPGAVKGRVALELSLVRASDRAVVWAGSRTAEHPAARKGVAGVVEALNAASERALDELLRELTERVGQELAKSAEETP
jgi:ABC-type uncharacterized transport system auxiliary subunit